MGKIVEIDSLDEMCDNRIPERSEEVEKKHLCKYRARLDELSEAVLMMSWNVEIAEEAIDIARKCMQACERQSEMIKVLQGEKK